MAGNQDEDDIKRSLASLRLLNARFRRKINELRDMIITVNSLNNLDTAERDRHSTDIQKSLDGLTELKQECEAKIEALTMASLSLEYVEAVAEIEVELETMMRGFYETKSSAKKLVERLAISQQKQKQSSLVDLNREGSSIKKYKKVVNHRNRSGKKKPREEQQENISDISVDISYKGNQNNAKVEEDNSSSRRKTYLISIVVGILVVLASYFGMGVLINAVHVGRKKSDIGKHLNLLLAFVCWPFVAEFTAMS